MTNATFRNVDDKTLSEFRAEAVRLNKNIGELLSEAIQLWLHLKKRKIDLRKLEADPLWREIRRGRDWGKGTENASMEVDRTLYR